VTWANARSQFESEGISAADAAVFAAIGTAESSLDLSVINDTPSTGDYSVGAWQINYLGSLYASRVAAFGTPKQLILNGLTAQVRAAITLWRESGFRPWSTFNSGAYKQYLHGAPVPGAGPGGGITSIAAPTNPGKDSWSHQVRGTAGHLAGAAKTLSNASKAIDILRR
jgi:hypothetical protein